MIRTITRSHRPAFVALVGLHLLLMAAYTLPVQLVPERLRLIGQWYARPLFHQQWRLFAPDPPLCSCALEYSYGGQWWSIDRGPEHWAQRRAVRTLAHHVQAWVACGERTLPVPLTRAMDTMVHYTIGEPGVGRPSPPPPVYRLVERCVTDPADPASRELRITPLQRP